MVGSRQRERGAALVEFAFVVPLLALFLFGIVQFGIAYDKQQSINSASREGARRGALKVSTMEDIAANAIATYGASASPGSDPTVQVEDSGGLIGTRDAAGVYTIVGASTHPNPQPARHQDETLMPCGRDTPSPLVRVIVSTPYDITIPFFGVMPVTIDSEAEFRCE